MHEVHPAGRAGDAVRLPGREGARVEVRDTGIGIPPEAREKLFEKFYQVDAGSHAILHGVGLGYVSKAWWKPWGRSA